MKRHVPPRANKALQVKINQCINKSRPLWQFLNSNCVWWLFVITIGSTCDRVFPTTGDSEDTHSSRLRREYFRLIMNGQSDVPMLPLYCPIALQWSTMFMYSITLFPSSECLATLDQYLNTTATITGSLRGFVIRNYRISSTRWKHLIRSLMSFAFNKFQ